VRGAPLEVTVRRHVKLLGTRPVFAPPKGGKTRTVPLPATVKAELAAYLARFPARTVALPWRELDGDPVAVPLVVTTAHGTALNRRPFNENTWRPALAEADVPDERGNGMHALRHFYASVLLDAGESVKAVAEYLGHADAGFTLRVYTHLMPSSRERTRNAVDAALGSAACDTSVASDGG
jgi:integrase